VSFILSGKSAFFTTFLAAVFFETNPTTNGLVSRKMVGLQENGGFTCFGKLFDFQRFAKLLIVLVKVEVVYRLGKSA